MEPVDVVLGLGVEVAGDVADVLAAVGEEHDLLVILHPLRAQQLVQPAFGLVVVGLDPGERLGGAAATGGGGLVAGVDVAAVQGDDQGRIRPGHLLPFGGAGVDEAEPLLAELALQALRGALDLLVHRGGLQGPAEREGSLSSVAAAP